MQDTPVNIAIIASGTATNARNITKFFKDNNNVKVALLLTNRPDSGIPDIARQYDIPYYVFNREELYQSDKVVQMLRTSNIQLVILAGFLWLVPANLIQAYRNKILNIHPALLPKYGGKGMYGMRIHSTIKENKEKETGITIHLVDEEYDKGPILHQSTVEIHPDDTAEDIARKVHELEYQYYPKVIADYIDSNILQ